MNGSDDALDQINSRSLAGGVAVVTGGAQGIGRALVEGLIAEGMKAVVIFDRDTDGVGEAFRTPDVAGTRIVVRSGDARKAEDLEALVRSTEREFGRIDVFCSNAGVMRVGGVDLPESAWSEAWEINVMAHVRAARSALPGMHTRGEGVFVNVISAAGLLTAPGAVAYSVTKHAAMGFSEWLAINYADQGIGVTAVCPEAVDTALFRSAAAESSGVEKISGTGVLSPREIASATIKSIKAREFLVATHPTTLRNVQRKWADIDKWLGAMNSFLTEKEK